MEAGAGFYLGSRAARGPLGNAQVSSRCLALCVQQAFVEPRWRARGCGRQGHGLPGLGKPVRLFCRWANGVHECGALALSQGDAVLLSCCVLGPRHKIPQTGGLNVVSPSAGVGRPRPGCQPGRLLVRAVFPAGTRPPSPVSSRGGESELGAPSSVPSRGSRPPVLI